MYSVQGEKREILLSQRTEQGYPLGTWQFLEILARQIGRKRNTGNSSKNRKTQRQMMCSALISEASPSNKHLRIQSPGSTECWEQTIDECAMLSKASISPKIWIAQQERGQREPKMEKKDCAVTFSGHETVITITNVHPFEMLAPCLPQKRLFNTQAMVEQDLKTLFIIDELFQWPYLIRETFSLHQVPTNSSIQLSCKQLCLN